MDYTPFLLLSSDQTETAVVYHPANNTTDAMRRAAEPAVTADFPVFDVICLRVKKRGSVRA